MNTDALVSVIIPVYNAEKFIERCLDSITAGTYENIEIICVNDGSRDGSLSVMEKCREKDGRIKIINQENSGVSAARNAGLEAAAGDYIAFVDADDWIHCSCFELLVKAAQNENADIVVSGLKNVSSYEPFEKIDCTDVKVKILPESQRENLKFVTGFLYRSSLIKKYRFSGDVVIGEDTLFNVVLNVSEIDSGNSLKYVYTDETLYYYYQHDESALHKLTHEKGQKESAEVYLDLAKKAKTKKSRRIALERFFKSIFAYRYSAMVRCDPKEVKANVKRLCPQAIKLLPQTDFSLKKKFVYTVMYYFPKAYSFMRSSAEKKAKSQK